MKRLLILLLIFMLPLTLISQRAHNQINIDSLIKAEIKKLDQRHGMFVYNSSIEKVIKELKTISALNGINFKKYSYSEAKKDSSTYQAWTSSGVTKKIEIYTQSGTFTDNIVDLTDNKNTTKAKNVSNKLKVELIRIIRTQRPYLIELTTSTIGPLAFLKIDKNTYNMGYESVPVGIGDAYALLAKNTHAWRVR